MKKYEIMYITTNKIKLKRSKLAIEELLINIK